MRNLFVGLLGLLAPHAHGLSLPAVVPGVAECAVGFGQGLVGGYTGLYGALTTLDIVKIVIKSLGARKRGKAKHDVLGAEALATCTGHWRFDASTSESLEPFLIACGAPKMIARMVGRKGKDVEIQITEQDGSRRLRVSITVEGKAPEIFTSDVPTNVQTPRGVVAASLQKGATPTAFTVVKHGPREGESVTEVRRLVNSNGQGARLECTFTHTAPAGQGGTVSVARHYVRS